MTETIALVVFYFGLMIFAVLFIVSWAIYHRPKDHSLTLAKRNLSKRRQGEDLFSEHAVSEEEASAVLEVIDVITKCRRAYGTLVKRALYLGIVGIALLFAVFAPNPVWVRLGIVLAIIVIVLLMVYVAFKPLRKIRNTDKELTARFEAWADAHPELSEKAPKAGRSWQSPAQSYVPSDSSVSYTSKPSSGRRTGRASTRTESDEVQKPWQ